MPKKSTSMFRAAAVAVCTSTPRLQAVVGWFAECVNRIVLLTTNCQLPFCRRTSSRSYQLFAVTAELPVFVVVVEACRVCVCQLAEPALSSSNHAPAVPH